MVNPNILLAAQRPDVVGSMAKGGEAGYQAAQFSRDAAMQRLFYGQGADIAAGNQGAVNMLAQFDPMAARGIMAEEDAKRRAAAAAAASAQRAAEAKAAQEEMRNLAILHINARDAMQGGPTAAAGQAMDAFNAALGQSYFGDLGVDFNTFPQVAQITNEHIGQILNPERVKGVEVGGELRDPYTGETIGQSAPVDTPTPRSSAAKLQADLNDGLIDQETYDASMAKLNNTSAATRVDVNLNNGGAPDTGTIRPGYQQSPVLDESNNIIGYEETIIPGSQVWHEMRDQAQKISRSLDSYTEKNNVVVEDIDRAINLIQTSQVPTTGLANWITGGIPGTPAYELNSLLGTVTGNVAFDYLADMRANSPTGGAVGQLSDSEREAMANIQGNIVGANRKQTLLYNLKRLRDVRVNSEDRLRDAYMQDFADVASSLTLGVGGDYTLDKINSMSFQELKALDPSVLGGMPRDAIQALVDRLTEGK